MRKSILGAGLILAVVTITFFGCKKEFTADNSVNSDNMIAEQIINAEEYNKKANEFAQTINRALSNKEFRKVLKNEVLKKFDGDYNVLLRTIVEKPLISSSEKSSYSVKDWLEECSVNGNSNNLKSSNTLIDELQERYPLMQIAVPVHAEDWDENSYIPDVTFIPSDFKDGETEYIIGYSSEGNVVNIDAINVPDEAVVVIGQNERTSVEHALTESGDGEGTGTGDNDGSDSSSDPIESPTPTGLAGTANEMGISLTWNVTSDANYGNTSGYMIYRKSASESGYSMLGISSGVYNKSYNDITVKHDITYSYYVISFNNYEYESPASNIVFITAESVPNGVTAFDALYYVDGEIELRWDNSTNEYIEQTNIKRKRSGIDSYYLSLVELPNQDVNYIDQDITSGQEYVYQIRQENNMGQSDAKYDLVKVAYRDISVPTAIYIKEMSFTAPITDVESWARGKPEFLVTLSNVNSNQTSASVIQDKIVYKFDKRDQSCTFNKNAIFSDWMPGYWWDKVSFNVVEDDSNWGDDAVTLTLSAGFNSKIEISGGASLNTEGTVNFSWEFVGKLQNVGNAYFDYYENPETLLTFPEYGFTMRVGLSK